MKLIFVRHGHPDYAKDCLTELGHAQARAVAKRLENETIRHIYASSCGRAVETAEYIAKVHGMDVEQCDFMREISWGSTDDTPLALNGHPWRVVDAMAADGQPLLNPNWATEEPFSRNKVVARVEYIGQEFDKLLAKHGYERDGDYYRVCTKNDDTYVIASHGGASSSVWARMFNLPFPFICASVHPEFTSITIVELNGEEGTRIEPRFLTLNEYKHIEGLETELVYE